MKRGAFVSAGILISLIAGLILFQIPGRRFFFVQLTAADVAGRCGTAAGDNHLLSKLQAALPRSAGVSILQHQPVLFSPRQGLVDPSAVTSFAPALPVFDLSPLASPVFRGRAPPTVV